MLRTQVTNFTQLFSTIKDFQQCQHISVARTCVPTVDVLYEDATLLVLKSEYIALCSRNSRCSQSIQVINTIGYSIHTRTSKI